MKWSQLKKRIESQFAESVQGRVEVWNTRYRNSHDSEGEGWITLDKERIWSAATLTYFVEKYTLSKHIQSESNCSDYRDPNQKAGYYAALADAEKAVHGEGVFTLWHFNRSLFDYLNLSIDEVMESHDPIIRAIGLLDQRFGKRRLLKFDPSKENPLVRRLFEVRCLAEGMHPQANTGKTATAD